MAFIVLLALLLSDAESGAKQALSAPWGTVRAAENAVETYAASVTDPAAEGKLALPTGLPPVVAAYDLRGLDRLPLSFEFGADGKPSLLQLPADFARRPLSERTFYLETADKTGQRGDGRIIFCVGAARILGATARLESQSGYRWIGSWTDPSDSVQWEYKATRPGMYDVELTCAAADKAETSIEIAMAGRVVAAPLPSTGGTFRYTSVRVGRLYLPKPGEHRLEVRCTKTAGPGVMHLSAVTLRPACEGKPIVQASDGSVTCHARDVTIHGVQVQYEPKPEKNTVGFWTIPGDRVTWDFTLNTPGTFDVEILQGCGKGQGGSEVELSVGGQPLGFVVEDTGHFQNFVPRMIGRVKLDRPGRHEILVKPLRKAGVAVMDLRQVRLVPNP